MVPTVRVGFGFGSLEAWLNHASKKKSNEGGVYLDYEKGCYS